MLLSNLKKGGFTKILWPSQKTSTLQIKFGIRYQELIIGQNSNFEN